MQKIIFFAGVLILLAQTVTAQNQEIEGSIIEVTDRTVTVSFDRVDLSVGDELRFIRRHEIVDPVTNRVRGGRNEEIATGVVEDIGLGRSVVSIIQQSPNIEDILLTDMVFYTGRVKRVIRTREVVGTVQSLVGENEIEIDVGSDDEINEGDMFLIRRTENVFDPETSEVVETRSIDVGRGRVDSVNLTESRASIIEFLPGFTVSERDEVVFEPESAVPEPVPVVSIDSEVAVLLQAEVDELRAEVAMLSDAVDSLGRELKARPYEAPPSSTPQSIQAPAAETGNMVARDDADLPDNLPAGLADDYRRALDDCLSGNYDRAITGFTDILARYPEQPLTENCRYWIGQSRFNTGDYTGAAEQFRQVVVDTRFDHKDDDAAIMMGITYYSMGRIPEAMLEFESFLRRYPDSEYRRRAQSWLDRLS